MTVNESSDAVVIILSVMVLATIQFLILATMLRDAVLRLSAVQFFLYNIATRIDRVMERLDRIESIILDNRDDEPWEKPWRE